MLLLSIGISLAFFLTPSSARERVIRAVSFLDSTDNDKIELPPSKYSVQEYLGRKSTKSDDDSFHGIRPISYALTIQLYQPVNAFFNGTVTLTFEVASEPINFITLHYRNLTFDSAKFYLDGHQIQQIYRTPESEYLTLWTGSKPLEPKSRHEITIENYDGAVNGPFTMGLFSTPVGFFSFLYPQRAIATQFQMDFARSVFPCVDLPKYKAKFTISVIHPSSLIAISNTPSESVKSIGPMYKETRFTETPVMPVYTTAFAVLPKWYRTEQEIVEDLLIRLWFDPIAFTTEEGQRLFGFAKFAFRKIRRLFTGIPLPLVKLDIFIIPRFVVYGMENWGLILLQEDMLRTQPDAERLSLFAHEITHQWISNLITVDSWNDLCFQEGLTEHFARRVVKDYFGDNSEWWAYIIKRYLDAWNDEDRFIPPKELVHEFNYLHEVSSQCFGKPPQIIAMLENFIGQAEFDVRIRKFLKDYQYGTFNLTDAAQEFDAIRMGTSEMSKFLIAWFTKPGYPTVIVERKPGEFARIRMHQMHVYCKNSKIS